MFRAGRQIAPVAAVGEPAAIVPAASAGGGANGHSSSDAGCHGSRATMAMTMRAIGAMRSVAGARPPRPLSHEYDAAIGGLCLVNSGLHHRRRNRTGIRSRPCKRHGACRDSSKEHLLHTFSPTFQFARHNCAARPKQFGVSNRFGLLVGPQQLDASVECPALQGRVVPLWLGRSEAACRQSISLDAFLGDRLGNRGGTLS